MPFELTNALIAVMQLINNMLVEYLDKFVIILIDDILIYSKDQDEYSRHLRIVGIL